MPVNPVMVQISSQSCSRFDKKENRVQSGKTGIWLVPLISTGFIFLIYRRFLAGYAIATGDLQTYFYPYWVAVVRSLRAGELPLWNPSLFSGVPFLANSQVGFFYPLNWPFWLLAIGKSLSTVTYVLHLSIVLHLCVAFLSMYSLAYTRRLSMFGSICAGLLYAGSGFLGIHVEHLNQLQALAWMPLVFLPSRKRKFTYEFPPPLSLLALAMILLAGHTQMAFITGLALLVWHLFRNINLQRISGYTGLPLKQRILRLIKSVLRWSIFFLPFIIPVIIAGLQLLPTAELLTLSTRQEGLDWREAVSFSLHPRHLLSALLPPYIVSLKFPESVAYVGLIGLCLMSISLWVTLKKRNMTTMPFMLLGLTGLGLALGGYNPLYLVGTRLGIPGFIHFRAPVRFLAIYILAASFLAGYGYDYLRLKLIHSIPAHKLSYVNTISVVLLMSVCVELLISAEWLPHADATIPIAYDDIRPATAHIISATELDREVKQVPGRFLSLSQMLFEVGDKQEIESIYKDVLSDDALWAFLVSEKQREVMTPNMSMVYDVYAADGYDGGLLPLYHYRQFSRLFLEGGTPDGRLRENLLVIPETRWLKLLHVHYVMTDKVVDVWIDDILYDRQFTHTLSPEESLTLGWLPESYTADGIGLLYSGAGGKVTVTLHDGVVNTYELPSVMETMPYRIGWRESATVTAVTLSAGIKQVSFSGISLINKVSQSFYPLTLSDTYQLVHSGDVKIYEDIHPSPYAYFVTNCSTSISDEDALAQMAKGSYNPLSRVVLAEVEADTCPAYLAEHEITVTHHTLRVLDFKAGKTIVEVQTEQPGFLVLSNAWYPGWQAVLTRLEDASSKEIQPILRGNIMFQIIPVPKGNWLVTVNYRSEYLIPGFALSAVGVVLLILYWKKY